MTQRPTRTRMIQASSKERHDAVDVAPSGAVDSSRLTATSSDSASSSGTRWSVVQRFVHDGFHYQIRRRPLTEPPSRRLTQREDQVLAHLCEGRSNKAIAYTLGVAPSTVGVLVYRASAKLGARTRRELLSAYVQLKRGREAEEYQG